MRAPAPSSWSFQPPRQAPVRSGPGDLYLKVLGFVLLAYALLGRSAAYVGVPPLFIGEVLLGVGLVLVLLARRPQTFFAAPAMWACAMLIVWVAIRTVPYIPAYALDAPRDGMMAGYIFFAFIVVGLLLERPERLRDLLVRYRTLVVVICSVAWAIYLTFRLNPELFPFLPWAPTIRVVENKPGDLMVHMTAITAFVVLGFKRPKPWLIVLLIVGTGALAAGTRGGMMGFVFGMAAFAVMKPKSARFGKLAYIGAFLVIAGLAVDTTNLEVNEGNRSLSLEQLWENAKSVFGRSDQAMLKNTAEWRLQWWEKIIDYTVFGEYRWTGKGFGRNIATEDGFAVDDQGSLRSPHNSVMTLLARGGIPAVVLWTAIHGLWFWSVLRAWLHARREGLTAWTGFFALCVVFWIAAQVNGIFDVYLEGPMGAIWFWAVFGAAIAGARLVRTHPTLLDDVIETADGDGGPGDGGPEAPTWAWRPPAEPRAAAPIPSWTPVR